MLLSVFFKYFVSWIHLTNASIINAVAAFIPFKNRFNRYYIPLFALSFNIFSINLKICIANLGHTRRFLYIYIVMFRRFYILKGSKDFHDFFHRIWIYAFLYLYGWSFSSLWVHSSVRNSCFWYLVYITCLFLILI
jgi:hypothetical protein